MIQKLYITLLLISLFMFFYSFNIYARIHLTLSNAFTQSNKGKRERGKEKSLDELDSLQPPTLKIM